MLQECPSCKGTGEDVERTDTCSKCYGVGQYDPADVLRRKFWQETVGYVGCILVLILGVGMLFAEQDWPIAGLCLILVDLFWIALAVVQGFAPFATRRLIKQLEMEGQLEKPKVELADDGELHYLGQAVDNAVRETRRLS